MSIEQPTATAGLVNRAKNILLSPKAEWQVIATETTGVGALLTGYVLPLAAIGALASMIGSVLIGGLLIGAFAIVPALIGACVSIAFSLLGVFLWGLLINALASSFGSTPNQTRAHQLSAYSATAGLVGTWGGIIPFVGGLIGIAGAIYSIVLLFLGLSPMMNTPEDKRILYTIVLVLIAIVAGWVAAMVFASMALMGLGMGAMSLGAMSFNNHSNPSQVEGTLNLGDGNSIDLGELQEAANQAQQAYEQGAAVTVDPARLQALLPDALPGGFARTSISSSSTGAMGMNAAEARADYTRGDATISLSVLHMGAMSGMAAMAGAVNVQQSTEDANGYSRTNTVDGRMITEELNRASNSATYNVVARNGMAINANGTGATPEEVRAAVEAVGVARAEALGAT